MKKLCNNCFKTPLILILLIALITNPLGFYYVKAEDSFPDAENAESIIDESYVLTELSDKQDSIMGETAHEESTSTVGEETGVEETALEEYTSESFSDNTNSSASDDITNNDVFEKLNLEALSEISSEEIEAFEDDLIIDAKMVDPYALELTATVQNNTPVSGSLDDCDLNDFSNWRYGHYNWSTGLYESYTSRICLKEYKTVTPGDIYSLLITDTAFQITIREFDSSNKFINTFTLANNNSYTVSPNAAYIGLSLYNIKYASVPYDKYKTLFENGLAVSLTNSNVDIDKNTDTCDNKDTADNSEQNVANQYSYGNLDDCNLNDFSNWRYGHYNWTNGLYGSYASRICLNEYKTVNPGTKYDISISNTDFQITIREFNEAGTFTKSHTLANNKTYTVSNDTAYIGVTIYNVKNASVDYNKYKSLFENGFTLNMLNTTPNNNNDSVINSPYSSLDACSLEDFANWRYGQYNWTNGLYSSYASRICLNDYKSVKSGDKYKVSISNTDFQITIREFNESAVFTNSITLANNNTYTVSKDTAYVGITIYNIKNASVTYDKYRNLFANGFKVSLTKSSSQPKPDTNTPQPSYDKLDGYDLNNFSNWRYGHYSIDSGKYWEFANRICLNDYKAVTPGEKYYISLTNLNFHVLIRELANDGSYIAGYDLANGNSYKVSAKTAYVGVSLYNIKGASLSYDQYKTLFENGLKVEISKNLATKPSQNNSASSSSPIITDGKLEDCDLSDFSNWQTGAYDSTTGICSNDARKICLTSYKSINQQTTYDIYISNPLYKLSIVELDVNKKVITSYDMGTVNNYIAGTNAAYVGLSLYNPNSSDINYDTYKSLFNTGINITVNEHSKLQTDDSYKPTSVYDAARYLLQTADPKPIDVSEFNESYVLFVLNMYPILKNDFYLEYQILYNADVLYTTNGPHLATLYLTNAEANRGFEQRLNNAKLAINEVLSQVDAKMTDLDKVVLAHEYVVDHTVYYDDDNLCYSAGGPLGEGFGVCKGYALAMNLLLHYMNVETDLVISKEMNHGWSYVKINNEWYHVDPTWDDTQKEDNGQYKHRFLIRNDEEFDNIYAYRNHYNWSVKKPASTSNAFTQNILHDINSDMYYYNGYWYYLDSTTNSIMKADLNANTKALVLDGMNKPVISLVGITNGVLTYKINNSNYKITL